MKLFSWVQNKLSGNQSTSKPYIHPCQKNQSVKSGDQKEEFSDWPNGILSIGTLFNKELKDDTKERHNDLKDDSEKHVQHLTSEEVNRLQEELNSLISSNELDALSGFVAENNNGLSSDTEENDQEEEKDDQHYTNIPNNKANDVYLDKNIINAISKKSLSFLIKKMFICGGGLDPSPTFSLRDPTLLPPKTRKNKILRALLRKKIYPQSSCQTMTRKKCLESRQTGNNHFDEHYDDDNEGFYLEGNDSSKWVKTDTDYIVLEI